MISPERIAEDQVEDSVANAIAWTRHHADVMARNYGQYGATKLYRVADAYLALLAEREEIRRMAFEEAAKRIEETEWSDCYDPSGPAEAIRALSSDRKGKT